jgi:hypothetical protein
MSRFKDKKGCGSTYIPIMTINELIVILASPLEWHAIMLAINSTSSSQTHNEIPVKWTTYHMRPHTSMPQPKLNEDLKVAIMGQ